ncbi:unnamed protein product [Nippostrongylus brasiliensis]|uniref:Cell death-related nuclease 4 (inferred by orthology to a C. elegans protein) n=1 Tax=Nippostrongylus brasiliensis TaxID=27835 RepID=A0A0N4XPY7_NIPBR|nr:unnamed protein product [Nippostrongylus brasiliensis]
MSHVYFRGTKKQLRARLRRYYRKEFSMYRMLHEGDSVPRLGNKTARHFDYLVVSSYHSLCFFSVPQTFLSRSVLQAIDFECTCVEVIYDYPHEIIEFPAVLIDVRQMRIVEAFCNSFAFYLNRYRIIIDTFRSFVKPEKNPILDQFCVQLTGCDFLLLESGISQSTVDSAPTFRDAYRLFRDWMARHSLGDSGCRYAFVTDGSVVIISDFCLAGLVKIFLALLGEQHYSNSYCQPYRSVSLKRDAFVNDVGSFSDTPHDLWKFFQFQCILSNFGTIPHDCRHFINIKRIFEQRVMKLVKGNGQSGIQNMLSHYNLSFEGQKHCGLDDSINIARLCIKLMQDRIELRINQRMTRKQDRNEVCNVAFNSMLHWRHSIWRD